MPANLFAGTQVEIVRHDLPGTGVAAGNETLDLTEVMPDEA
ncbi:MAG: hypothetical protein OEP52_00155 [Acidimicrobiia bacterium]|nr:hypothetical protein [Acidimicrobiia bacterium]